MLQFKNDLKFKISMFLAFYRPGCIAAIKPLLRRTLHLLKHY
jgi:hypothetical protein